MTSLLLFLLGFTQKFYMLAFVNDLIPSKQRATILSFNSLMGSSGGVVFQPALGRAADVFGCAATYLMSSVLSAFALIFVFLARFENTQADRIKEPYYYLNNPLL